MVISLFIGTIGGATTFASAKVKNAIGRIGIFNLEFQPKFGIQLGVPIPMGINLGECRINLKKNSTILELVFIIGLTG